MIQLILIIKVIELKESELSSDKGQKTLFFHSRKICRSACEKWKMRKRLVFEFGTGRKSESFRSFFEELADKNRSVIVSRFLFCDDFLDEKSNMLTSFFSKSQSIPACPVSN